MNVFCFFVTNYFVFNSLHHRNMRAVITGTENCYDIRHFMSEYKLSKPRLLSFFSFWPTACAKCSIKTANKVSDRQHPHLAALCKWNLSIRFLFIIILAAGCWHGVLMHCIYLLLTVNREKGTIVPTMLFILSLFWNDWMTGIYVNSWVWVRVRG